MGCAPSMVDGAGSTEYDDEALHKAGAQRGAPHNVVAAYIDFDKRISQEETQSPAPELARAVARQQQIRVMLQSALEDVHRRDDSASSSTILQVIHDLGLHRNERVAAEHEEFVATVNRKAMNHYLVQVLSRKLQELEGVVQDSRDRVTSLQTVYQQQDSLLGSVFGEDYGSEKEKLLEQELDTMRNYRDTLSSGVSQWRECGRDITTASDLSQRGLQAYTLIATATSVAKADQLTTEARNSIHEAVLLVQLCHETLPGVQFPYCTSRELGAITQALQYIFTDIQIQERFDHAKEVYGNFQQRAKALAQWTHQMLNTSLKKDLTDIDAKVGEISGRLRNERIHLMCDKLKIPNNYNRFGLNPGVENLRPAGRIMGGVNTHPETMVMGTGRRKGDQEPTRPEIPDTRYILQDHGMLPGVNLGPTLGFNSRVFQDPNLQKDWEQKLASRQNSMWPSRRIEELRMLTLSHLDH